MLAQQEAVGVCLGAATSPVWVDSPSPLSAEGVLHSSFLQQRTMFGKQLGHRFFPGRMRRTHFLFQLNATGGDSGGASPPQVPADTACLRLHLLKVVKFQQKVKLMIINHWTTVGNFYSESVRLNMHLIHHLSQIRIYFPCPSWTKL